MFKTRLFSHFSEPCTWILLLFRFPAFELQLEPNSFNVGQKFKLPILTRLSSVRWLAVDLWISEQEINGLNPPLWAKYYSSSSYRKKHLYLEGLEKKSKLCFRRRNEMLKMMSFMASRINQNQIKVELKIFDVEEKYKARDLLSRFSNKLYNCLQLDACNPNYIFIS